MAEISELPPVQSAGTITASNKDILTTAKGGGIIFAGKLFNYVSRFIFGIIVARAIGAGEFGLYNLTIKMVLTLSTVAIVGFPAALIHFLPLGLRKRDDVFVWDMIQAALALTTIISVVCALTVYGFADFLAENLFQEPSLAPLLRLGSVCIPLAVIGRILISATAAFKQMQYQVYADDIVLNVTRIGLTILFLSIGFGVAGVVASYVISWFIALILMAYFLNRLFRLRRPTFVSLRRIRQLLVFSFPILFTNVIGKFESNFEVIFLGILGSAVWVGVYSAALRIQVVGVMFLTAIQIAIMPVIADLYHQKRKAELNQLYQTVTKWSLAFTLPFFLMTLLFARPILSIFGEEFETGALALIVLSLGTLVNGGTGICGPLITMTGYGKIKMINSIITVIVTLVLYTLLIPKWGMVGAAAATGLAIAIVNIINTVQVYRLLGLWAYNRDFIKPIIAGIAAFLVTLFLDRVLLTGTHLVVAIPKIGFFWLSYAGFTLLLGLTEEDKVVLGRFQTRLNKTFHRS